MHVENVRDTVAAMGWSRLSILPGDERYVLLSQWARSRREAEIEGGRERFGSNNYVSIRTSSLRLLTGGWHGANCQVLAGRIQMAYRAHEAAPFHVNSSDARRYFNSVMKEQFCITMYPLETQ